MNFRFAHEWRDDGGSWYRFGALGAGPVTLASIWYLERHCTRRGDDDAESVQLE